MNTKKIFIIIIATITFSACKKSEIKPIIPKKVDRYHLNPTAFTEKQCLNKEPISKVTPYKTLKFFDGFDGAIPGDPCYSQKPWCLRRMDWSMYSNCMFDETKPEYAGIRDLNKCTWKVWDGYSFWATNKLLKFDPRAIEVSNGRLILKLLPNPDYDPSKPTCGSIIDPNEGSLDRYSNNCKFIGGAVDSSDEAAGNSRGKSFKFGRVEIKARYVKTSFNGAFPALWTWEMRPGRGTPYIGDSSTDQWFGEIDILEWDHANGELRDYALQTYHDWDKSHPEGSAAFHHRVKLDDSTDHVYGIEWTPTSLKWYIDDCYTAELKTGDQANFGPRIGQEIRVTNAASFLMMWLGGSGYNFDTENRDRLEIDEVRFYE